jgi:hypothetical protein
MHRTVQSYTALPDMKPFLLLSRFHGDNQSKRKENSSQDPYWRLRVYLRYRTRIHIPVQEY